MTDFSELWGSRAPALPDDMLDLLFPPPPAQPPEPEDLLDLLFQAAPVLLPDNTLDILFPVAA